MYVKFFLRHVIRYIVSMVEFFSPLRGFIFSLRRGREAWEASQVKSSQVAASCARSSINVACTRTLKSHRMRKNFQALAYKHFHVGILVMPHFHVHYIIQFDQSSRLTACFRLTATGFAWYSFRGIRKIFVVPVYSFVRVYLIKYTTTHWLSQFAESNILILLTTDF